MHRLPGKRRGTPPDASDRPSNLRTRRGYGCESAPSGPDDRDTGLNGGEILTSFGIVLLVVVAIGVLGLAWMS